MFVLCFKPTFLTIEQAYTFGFLSSLYSDFLSCHSEREWKRYFKRAHTIYLL